MTQEQKLARLHNRPTGYEVAAIKGETRILVAYCQRHSFSGLRNAVYNRAEKVVALTGKTEFQSRKGDMLLGDWTIRFTGRTQRDAILEGELPYVGEIKLAGESHAA